jgi:hypothetical protein
MFAPWDADGAVPMPATSSTDPKAALAMATSDDTNCCSPSNAARREALMCVKYSRNETYVTEDDQPLSGGELLRSFFPRAWTQIFL